jgi:6-pyruvoyltetrahydropterin/6-carboxytetrahydropterin synthase
MAFTSSKLFDGFSTVFRQYSATDTHCSFLHGYDVEFQVFFEGELDGRNWVWDFGGMKRAKGTIDGMNPKQWLDYMFDHTTCVAETDPYLPLFKQMDDNKIIQLRILPAVGAEKFAQYLYEKIGKFVSEETDGRVKVTKVDFYENRKNMASYSK